MDYLILDADRGAELSAQLTEVAKDPPRGDVRPRARPANNQRRRPHFRAVPRGLHLDDVVRPLRARVRSLESGGHGMGRLNYTQVSRHVHTSGQMGHLRGSPAWVDRAQSESHMMSAALPRVSQVRVYKQPVNGSTYNVRTGRRPLLDGVERQGGETGAYTHSMITNSQEWTQKR